jgi:hypothetical protein
MDFLELRQQFEKNVKHDFELLELHYAPYSFGSGMTAYRIKGKIIKVAYDGRDDQVELLISAKHDKYSNASWTTILTGNPTDLINKGIPELKNILEN